MSSLLVTATAPPPPSLVSTTPTSSFSSPRSLRFSPAATAGGSTPTPTLTSPRLYLCSAPPWSKRGVFVSCAKSVPAEAFWEDPDVGYDSEWGEGDEEDDGVEEEEEGEGEGAGEASVAHMGGRRGSSTESSHDQEIPAEIELLLSAEEKAILQQNEVSNLNKISTKKWNLFHTLALSGQIPIMDNLLKDGVHIDAVDKDGYTALHKAVIGKKEAVISHLLRKGANPHCQDRDGATPLHYTVQVGAMQTVKLLIKYKVDVNVADNDGWTPLHIAIQSRSRDIAKVLLINGADKTRRNKDGKTPLDISLCYGRDFKSYELAKLLKLVPAGRDL